MHTFFLSLFFWISPVAGMLSVPRSSWGVSLNSLAPTATTATAREASSPAVTALGGDAKW